MPLMNPPQGCAGGQRGLSLVELMVGMTIGLFIVAGAALLTGTQLGENRKLILETQVHQDLRAAADIITRELRRAGYDLAAENQIWSAGIASGAATTPPKPAKASVRVGLNIDTAGGEKVAFKYDRPLPETTADFGYRLVNGTIRFRAENQPLQDVTDRSTLEVTNFDVVRETAHTEQMACPRLCPDGTQACWPTVSITSVTITITGRAVADPNFSRTVISKVRLRNDGAKFNTGTVEVCP
jgi:prepilin-type N-terminal cleavage/methylation domain-containing protein